MRGFTQIKHPDPRATELYEDLPDEVAEVCTTQTSFERQVWQLFFDGASRTGPQGHIVAEVCLTQTSFEGQVWQLFFDDASRTGPQGHVIAEWEWYLFLHRTT